jgi:hypothetical protein
LGHQLLVYADGVNILGDNTDDINKAIGTLIGANKEVGVEVNTGKAKCKLLTGHQNTGQSHVIKTANRSLENEAHYKI